MSHTRFLYVRDENRFPVGCIAYKRSSADEAEDITQFGYSIYNPKDKFNRHMARHVAEGRMVKTPRLHMAEVEHAHPNAILHDICLTLQEELSIPNKFWDALETTRLRLLEDLV